LFDYKEQNLKPTVVAALQRIFFLCDKDQDSLLSPSELHSLQAKCFNKPLTEEDMQELKRIISAMNPNAIIPIPANPTESGLTEEGFVLLNKLFAEKGRHETVWNILRKFHYTDSLSLRDSFLLPRLDCPVNCSAELSPSGYRFFVDLFSLFDKDNDGALNPNELKSLFRPTPGLPDSFLHGGSVRNEEGNITLQGWLAHWSMETRVDHKATLKYLAYLGYEDGTGKGTVGALKVTKARKRKVGPGGTLKGVGTQGKGGRVERNVLLCYVLGKQGSGKVCGIFWRLLTGRVVYWTLF
jgi:mitochondrial Rho GTPase 1